MGGRASEGASERASETKIKPSSWPEDLIVQCQRCHFLLKLFSWLYKTTTFIQISERRAVKLPWLQTPSHPIQVYTEGYHETCIILKR